MKTKLRNIQIASAVLATTLIPAVALADPVDNCGQFLPPELCTDDPMALIGVIANMLVGLFGVLFVIMIIVAGAQMASAADSPDRLKAAKSRLVNAIVSLVLLISLRAIMALFGINIV